MGDMPSYEELKESGTGRLPVITLRLDGIAPGGVALASDVWGREMTARGISSALNRLNKKVGRHEYVGRQHEGILYVVRLKPEDIKEK